MTREEMLEKSLESLRTIAKAQGVKSITKYRKAELVDIIMSGGAAGKVPHRFQIGPRRGRVAAVFLDAVQGHAEPVQRPGAEQVL